MFFIIPKNVMFSSMFLSLPDALGDFMLCAEHNWKAAFAHTNIIRKI